MSFNQDNYKPIAGQSNPDVLFDDHLYRTTDSQDEVEGAGYFDTAPPLFGVPDRLHITFMIGGSVDKVITYLVTDITDGSISIEDALTYSPGIINNTDAIEFLESVIGAPEPIPPGDPDVLQFAIADDTTIGSVALWNETTMTNWDYSLDSSATPTGEGTEGTINVVALNLGDYDSHVLYGWYKDTNDTGIWTQVKPDPLLDDNQTVPGLVVQANAVAAAVAITDFAVNTTAVNDESEINISFTETTIIDDLALTYDL